MSVGSPTAGTWSSSQWRPDNEFETDRLPALNQCWFADRVVAVRRKFGLTIDQREAAVLDRVLAGCSTTAMLMVPRFATSTQRPTLPPAPPPRASDALVRWDDNGNGRITCASRIPNSLAESRIEAPLRGAWCLASDNEVRSHASLKGHTPLTFAGGHMVARAELNNVRWVSHCRALVQLPVAA